MLRSDAIKFVFTLHCNELQYSYTALHAAETLYYYNWILRHEKIININILRNKSSEIIIGNLCCS